MKHSLETDEARIKTRLMVEIAKTKDLPTLIGLVGAWAKIRAMELKQEDGDWGESLSPNLTLPPVDADTHRSPHRS
jgi:hypothetical protein